MAGPTNEGGRLERHYDAKAAAKMLGVSPSTIKSWGRRGLIPRIKLPGRRGKVLYRESDLVALLDRFREQTPGEIADRLLDERR